MTFSCSHDCCSLTPLGYGVNGGMSLFGEILDYPKVTFLYGCNRLAQLSRPFCFRGDLPN